MLESKSQTRCRVCDSTSLFTYLNLGKTPLANSYVKREDLSSEEFCEELALQVCTTCGLSQLTKVVHPDLMFKNYLYVSSTTQTFRDHCTEMAATLTKSASCKPGDLALDIASNDGCLLSKFKEIGMNVIGVDPAENLAREANAAGIKTLNTYWSRSVADEVVHQAGKPKIVTATNVFAHVDDVHEFVKAVEHCLADKGIFVIEFPYVLDFIEKNEFDTAYHEHLSYIGITPAVRLMSMHGMKVFDIEYFGDLHGGTTRIYVCRDNDRTVSENVKRYLDREAKFQLTKTPAYEAFAERVRVNKEKLVRLLEEERKKGKKIWAYGASAKGNTLVNFFSISNNTIPVAIDDNPKKWDYYTPGSKMRITSIKELSSEPVDHLLLLAWNFQEEIIRRCRVVGYKGSFILPCPEPKIVS